MKAANKRTAFQQILPTKILKKEKNIQFCHYNATISLSSISIILYYSLALLNHAFFFYSHD